MLNVKLNERSDLICTSGGLQVCGSGEHKDSEGSEDNCYGDYRRRGLHGNHGGSCKKIVFPEEEMDELERFGGI